MARSSTRVSSLYTSGQCLLSVLGSVGVILLFAGIPQLIYASHVSAGSLLTFLLGALLITLMVTGNAFIGYKYRQLIRERRQGDSRSSSFSNGAEDKPPSYDDLIKQEEKPPSYAAVTEKPPRYEEYINEVYNWEAASRLGRCKALPCQSSSGNQEVQQPSPSLETPIIVPLHRSKKAGLRFHRQNAVESIAEERSGQGISGKGGGRPSEFKIQVENLSYANPSFSGSQELCRGDFGTPVHNESSSMTQRDRQKLFFNPSFENETIEEACPMDSPTNGPMDSPTNGPMSPSDIEEGVTNEPPQTVRLQIPSTSSTCL